MTARFAPFDAVVFDMDGTLIDTEYVFRDIVFRVADTLGYEMTDDIHHAMVGGSHEATSKLLVEAYGSTFPYSQFDEQCRFIMTERLSDAVPVKPGVVDLLDQLDARFIPYAVATSSRQPHAVLHLGAAGLLDRFAAIVTRDDVEHPKPHPEPYLTAAHRLGVSPSRCIAFEDSHAGVRAAHAAGMQTVMVPDMVRPTAEIEALCVTVMKSLSEAPAAVWPLA